MGLDDDNRKLSGEGFEHSFSGTLNDGENEESNGFNDDLGFFSEPHKAEYQERPTRKSKYYK